MSDIQLTADSSDIQTMNRELLETAKNARSSARVFEAEFNRVERLLNKTAKTNQQYFNSVLGVGTATKSASDSAEVFNKSLNRQAAEVDRLAKKFNPLYRASKQYESAVEEIDKAHKMGAISLSQHEAALEQLNTEYARFNSGVAPAANSLYQFGQQTRFAGKSANRFGMRVQQVGYQVGDFLVQVQSGTSWLVAFGQQGTQLAGLLPGVAGAVIGIGLALSTAIGGVVMRQYFNNVSDLKDALKELRQETKDNADEVERLARGFSSVNALRVADEIERLKKEIKSLSESEQRSLRQGAALDSGRLDGTRKRIVELEKELKVAEERFAKEQFYESQRAITAAAIEAGLRNRRAAEEEAARAASVSAKYLAEVYREAYSSMEAGAKAAAEKERQSASATVEYLKQVYTDYHQSRAEGARLAAIKTAEVEERAASNTATYLKLVYGEYYQSRIEGARLAQIAEERASSNTVTYLSQMYSELYKSQEESAKLAEGLYEAYKNGESFAELSLEYGVNAAAIAAGKLAEQLGVSLSSALRMVQLAEQPGRGDPRDFEKGSLELGYRFPEHITYDKPNLSSRGGGSPKVDPLEQLRQRIKLETELLGKTEAQKEMIRALGVDQSKYTQDQLANVESMIDALIREQEQREKIINLQETLANSATDLFFAAAKGADAFKASLASMLQTLARAIAQQAFLNALENTSGGGKITGFLGSIGKLVGFADGGAFNRGNVMAFAGGGVVSQPNFFPMAGGKTGLMGEAGPEAIMPLKRGKDGKLGVAAEGGGGSTVIQPQINIDARGAQQGVAEQINASITQALPTIIEATVSATKERSRRGAM